MTMNKKTGDDAVVNDKPRLLIAGPDLKFAKPAIELWQEWFTIRVDEWTVQSPPDPAVSAELLEWADVIWVEWMTGAAAWYSQRNRDRKPLIIRAHRYDVATSMADGIQWGNVANVVTVSPHVTEDVIDRFAVARSTVRMIPNLIDLDRYRLGDDPDRVYRLALVGSVPRLKGYMRALAVLSKLVNIDRRYSLTVFGKRPQDFIGTRNLPHELAYYAACDKYVQSEGLADHVRFEGWVDIPDEIGKYGFVLSVSDLESFHIAPGEAFSSGNQGLFLPWRGVQSLWPGEFIFEDEDAMARHVLENRDVLVFSARASEGRQFVEDNYSAGLFLRRTLRLFSEFRSAVPSLAKLVDDWSV